MDIMPSNKKLASLRLDEAVVDNIDAVMERFYRQVGGIPPSRNAQMEAWIIEGVERMQTRLTVRPAQAPAGAEGEAQ